MKKVKSPTKIAAMQEKTLAKRAISMLAGQENLTGI
jgi:hypothetical protein